MPTAGYFHGYAESHRQDLARRTAEEAAGFLLPRLAPGQRLLDCGCGPGSITLDLARHVAPGEAVGIDLEPTQIEAARALAQERGVANARFEVAGVLELPFETASFDVVFAHTLLVHLRAPGCALAEMARVLRPGGLVAIRDADWGALAWGPLTPALEKLETLTRRAAAAVGSPEYAGRQSELLAAAGFGAAETWLDVPDAGRDGAGFERWTRQWEEQFAEPGFVRAVVGQGWASASELDAMIAEFRGWRELPEAFLSVPFRAALAVKP